MSASDLKFGTSGLRGLATDLNGPPAFDYTYAFARLLIERGEATPGNQLLLGRDLRASSPDILRLCAAAAVHAGLVPIDCGALPTPALANYGLAGDHPAIMVTGSHIPEDRNGLKFYRAAGEIDKADEADIVRLHDELAVSEQPGHRVGTQAITYSAAMSDYVSRYVDFFPAQCLSGLRVGVYQHSSVARDLLLDLLARFGAEVEALGRSDIFVPVDTEALRAEDRVLARDWARDGRFDAIVSTDGDADRPLVADAEGRFLRGDLLGAATAHALGADCVVTPLTSNSGLERSGRFARVVRTRIGSPYVIEAMRAAVDGGAHCVVGFESNGGVLLGSAVNRDGRRLAALPTRDAMLPILCVLSAAKQTDRGVAGLEAAFGFGAAASDRLKDIPSSRSRPFLERLATDAAFRQAFFAPVLDVDKLDTRDGVKVYAADGQSVHFRASGNAPEFRCYVEAPTEPRAGSLLAWGLAAAGAYVQTANASA